MMSRRDAIHEIILNALLNDEWVVTHDPFHITVDGARFRIDLGAEKLVTATRENRKIVVEIKTFDQISINHDFYEALGQYLCYSEAIIEDKIDYQLYLAISNISYLRIKSIPFFAKRLLRLNLLIVELENQKIIEWID